MYEINKIIIRYNKIIIHLISNIVRVELDQINSRLYTQMSKIRIMTGINRNNDEIQMCCYFFYSDIINNFLNQ